jgi:16S rRNA (cytosine1402-N4)-methyltransferase
VTADPPPEGPPPASDAPPPHRRRPRYRGTHPRRFEQKYKELRPEDYPEESAKVLAQGRTPAGSHVSVLLAETIAALAPRPGEIGVDATLGRGGHAAALAAAVAPDGFVLGLDLDAEELERTRELLAPRALPLRYRHANFAGAAKALAAEGFAQVDFLLADLGVSSMQLDRPERGFSFKHDAPLDLRLDRSRGRSAAEWLAAADAAKLAAALARFGDVADADAMAEEIVARTAVGRPIRRTRELAELVLRRRGFDPKTFRQEHAYAAHPAAPVFQALRVAVNREDENLATLLRELPWLLKPGGRAALITFHSGEDDAVVASFAAGLAEGLYAHVAAPVTPGKDEVFRNPRSRSARLHVAVRAGGFALSPTAS